MLLVKDILIKLRFIFDRKQKWETVQLLFLIIIGTALELLGISTVQPLINSIMNPEKMIVSEPYKTIYEGLHLNSPMQLVITMIFILIIVYIVKNIYLVFLYNRQYKYIYSNMRKLSTKMMRSYLDRPYSYHTMKSSSELLRNINQDTADFFGVIQALVLLVTEGAVVLAIIVYLFIKDKSITMAVGVMLAFLIFLFQKLYKKNLLIMGEKNRHYEAQVNKWVQQAFGGIKEVKVMNKEDFFYDQYNKAFQGRVRSEYTYHTMITIPKPIIEAVSMTALLGAAALKIFLGANPTYFVPTLSIFVVAAYRLLPSFNRITEYMGTLSYQMPAVTSIYNDLKEIEDHKNVNYTVNEVTTPLPFNNEIKIDHLDFHYADSDKLILHDVNFSIKKNTSVAFIGQSGAGKTTLADIILGVLSATGGAILVDDTNIENHMQEWHKTIGYIPQNIYLMDDTIAANIAFGVSEDQIDEKQVWKAIEQAQLSDVISSLPEGIKTKVGERGIRLSGGQRQRIGIARALYNAPEILVLDEATSALDNETEKAVMESIDALHGEMTLIIIAHRLSTIQNCDVIYSIKDGKAVARNKV